MTTILALDPGGTTGIVVLRTPSTLIYSAQLEFVDAVHALDSILETDRLRCETPIDYVAIERFTITGRTLTGTRAGTHDALNIIGFVRARCLLKNIKLLPLQAPADAKAAFNDAVLRSTNMYNEVSGPHARDALRHALLAARRLKRLGET